MGAPAAPTDQLIEGRLRVLRAGIERQREDFARDVRSGLTASPKRLPCRYFYDREGSALFEAICDLPEYYLTRAEHEILDGCADTIAARVGHGATLVELGSGSGAKTRRLIQAFLARQPGLRYVPIDISTTALEDSARGLLTDFRGLEIIAIAGEYHAALERLATEPAVLAPGAPRLVLWLGSNIGNLGRVEAISFLAKVRTLLHPADRLLCGVDLRKDASVLVPAYDDPRGITARFNLNVLARVNRELEGHFELDRFRHRAIYDDAAGRIEMYLVSARSQRVRVGALGLEVPFEAGEAIHTEDSYKYSPAEIRTLAARAGYRIDEQWFDAGSRFNSTLLAPIA